jgi:hypothetical protein
MASGSFLWLLFGDMAVQRWRFSRWHDGGGGVVGSLVAAIEAFPMGQLWRCEVRCEPVADLEEFDRLADEAEAPGPGDFIARCPLGQIQSAGW